MDISTLISKALVASSDPPYLPHEENVPVASLLGYSLSPLRIELFFDSEYREDSNPTLFEFHQ